jgi:hypothetical protein
MRLGFEDRALSLESRCSTTCAMPPVHFVLVILEMGYLTNYFPRQDSNHSSSDLSILSSYDYRCELPVPDELFHLEKLKLYI